MDKLIKIGYTNGSFNFAEGKKTYLEINNNCLLEFNGKAIISKGTYICLNNKSKISLGNNFSCNANCLISSQNSIIFGDSCLLGWECTIIDDDGHKTESSVREKKIVIGDHVWIAAKASVLKGSKIGSGSIVGYGSIVSGDFNQKNILIVSSKTAKIKENVSWEK